MTLVLFNKTEREGLVYFGCIPTRSFLHSFLFGVLTFLLLTFCKKQLVWESIRRNAFQIVGFSTLGAAIILESIGVLARGMGWEVVLWNLLFDAVGIGIGMGVFHLFFRRCY